MTDSTHTNNDLDSYGVWVKRSGNFSPAATGKQEDVVSDSSSFGGDAPVADEMESFQSGFSDVSSIDDSPFEISDDAIASLDVPVEKVEAEQALSIMAEEERDASFGDIESSDVFAIDDGDVGVVDNAANDFADDADTVGFADFQTESEDVFGSDFEAPVVSEEIAPVVTEESEPAAETASVSVENSILEQIVSDLASLKSEISMLKDSFAELKNNPSPDKPFDSENDMLENSPNDSGGFFADDDGDETISLSGDELTNIMNSVNFDGADSGDSEIPADDTSSMDIEITEDDMVPESEQIAFEEEPSDEFEIDSGDGLPDLSSDVSGYSAVSESLGIGEISSDVDIDFSESASVVENDSEEDLPDEISVPKLDDVMVGSSDADFLDSGTAEPATDEFAIPDELPDDTVDDSYELMDETTFSEEFTSEEMGIIGEDHPAVADMMSVDPEIHESITDNHIDYLKTDENAVLDEDSPRAFMDDLIDTHDDSNDDDEDMGGDLGIPSGLKTEIKSVLLYMDQLLESLPEEKIVEFAQSEQFNTYKKLFSDLGLS